MNSQPYGHRAERHACIGKRGALPVEPSKNRGSRGPSSAHDTVLLIVSYCYYCFLLRRGRSGSHLCHLSNAHRLRTPFAFVFECLTFASIKPRSLPTVDQGRKAGG